MKAMQTSPKKGVLWTRNGALSSVVGDAHVGFGSDCHSPAAAKTPSLFDPALSILLKTTLRDSSQG